MAALHAQRYTPGLMQFSATTTERAENIQPHRQLWNGSNRVMHLTRAQSGQREREMRERKRERDERERERKREMRERDI